MFNRDYGHMFWYIREYLWKKQFDKLNETMDFEEIPYRYLLAELCMLVVCIFYSIIFAFEYIVFGKASGACWHEYIKYCCEKQKK